jgi:hypothetical protein
MQIPLNEFEQYINEKILARGLSYFKNGHVQEPELLSPGEYEFINNPKTQNSELLDPTG